MTLAASLLGYVPFLQPLPGVWRDGIWMSLLLPLCVAVAVVYKALKCRSVRELPRQAAALTVWILLGMAGAAVVLVVIVKATEHWGT